MTSKESLSSLLESIEKSLHQDSILFSHIEPQAYEFARLTVELPGQNKLKTTVLIIITEKHISFEAFICRNPDENFAGVYKYLLRRNRRLYIVRYTLDDLGDIYLVGNTITESFTPDQLDAILGQILQTADEDFNILLELGFRTAIRKEWQWRTSRGESLANLKPFEHLIEEDDSSG